MKVKRKAAEAATMKFKIDLDEKRYVEKKDLVKLVKDGTISGKGVFSSQVIRFDEPLLIYYGEIINEKEKQRRADFYISRGKPLSKAMKKKMDYTPPPPRSTRLTSEALQKFLGTKPFKKIQKGEIIVIDDE
uniref:Uncharacterized protein n=1 Tax=Panagrolaimus sp. ES5 TaxID=591445 RepID=A0AC34FIW5_9BILA